VSNEYSESACIVAENLCKTYRRGVEKCVRLQDVSFSIRSGELVSIVGQSGSGKTTLLNLIGCMDVPTSGTLHLGTQDIAQLDERARTQLRREQIGLSFSTSA
jgi:putative ABC transport system ATP-binding protein